MSTRPWRVESMSPTGWALNRYYGAFGSSTSAEKAVRKWQADYQAVTTRPLAVRYRLLNRETAEVIEVTPL